MEILDNFISSTSGETRALLIELREHQGPINEDELLNLIKDIVEGRITDINHITQSDSIDSI